MLRFLRILWFLRILRFLRIFRNLRIFRILRILWFLRILSFLRIFRILRILYFFRKLATGFTVFAKYFVFFFISYFLFLSIAVYHILNNFHFYEDGWKENFRPFLLILTLIIYYYFISILFIIIILHSVQHVQYDYFSSNILCSVSNTFCHHREIILILRYPYLFLFYVIWLFIGISTYFILFY